MRRVIPAMFAVTALTCGDSRETIQQDLQTAAIECYVEDPTIGQMRLDIATGIEENLQCTLDFLRRWNSEKMGLGKYNNEGESEKTSTTTGRTATVCNESTILDSSHCREIFDVTHCQVNVAMAANELDYSPEDGLGTTMKGVSNYLFTGCVELTSGESCAVVVEHTAPADYDVIMMSSFEGGAGVAYQICEEEGSDGFQDWFD